MSTPAPPSTSNTKPRTNKTVKTPVILKPAPDIDEYRSQGEFRSRILKNFHSKYKFALAGKTLYVFSEGRYIEADQEWVWARCTEFMGDSLWGHLTPMNVEAIRGTLRTNKPELLKKPPEGLVNLKNGILDPRTLKLTLATPSTWLSPIQIPIEWDPKATCPKIEKFLAMVFPDDAQEFIWELWGSFMVSDAVYQHLLWLTGPGGNGKGTFIKLVSRFLRPHSYPIPIRALSENRFAVADAAGRLLIYDADSPLEQIHRSEALKQLSGTDPMRAEHKGVTSFDFEPFAKVLIGANDAPDSKDISKGMLDRPLLIPCTRSIRGTSLERSNQNAFLAEMALEYPGALVKAMAGLARLLDRQQLLKPKSVKTATDVYKQQAHPMQDFFTECLELVVNGEIQEPELHERQKLWAEANDRRKLTNRAMAEWFEQNHPSVVRGRADRLTNKGSVVYRGVQWMNSQNFA